MKSDTTFTVFTPTFNRAHLLPRVHKSLVEQSRRDFEWVIIDDGSTDQTRDLAADWMTKSDFPIRYYWQANRGKHAAINRGMEKAQGFFFLIVDSDDWLPSDCLERFERHWGGIPQEKRASFAGVVGLWATPAGKVIGTPFPKDVLDSDTIEIRTRYRVKGDNFGILRTEVLREFPFPEDLGSFVAEGLIWRRIALKYKQRYVNDVLGYKEYQKGGLVDRIVAVKAHSSLAAQLCYKEYVAIDRPMPFDLRMKNYANYCRFSFHSGFPVSRQVRDVPSVPHWLLALPVGVAAYLRDLTLLRKEKGFTLENRQMLYRKAMRKSSTVSRGLLKEVIHTFSLRKHQRILFVVGCQRSGTTMMLDTFEKDLGIKVYKEKSRLTCNDRREQVRLNDLDQVKSILARDRTPVIALKPLVETQNVNRLLADFPQSKAIFMYRNYKDVARSNLQKFGINNGINNLRPIVRGEATNWRAEGISAATREIVLRHFSEDMNPLDAAALFWFVRNRLYFERDLETNSRVLMCRYEDLVADPLGTFARIYRFLGRDASTRRLARDVHTSSLGKGKDVRLSVEVENLCRDLQQKLDTTNQRLKTSQPVPSGRETLVDCPGRPPASFSP